MDKIDSLRKLLDEGDFDAVNIFSHHNIFYFSGFTGTTANLLITKSNQYLITDFRYVTQAGQQADSFEVVETHGEYSQKQAINDIIKKEKIRSIGIEGDFVSRNQWLTLEKDYHARINTIDLEPLREVKSSAEVEKIKDAIEIAETALDHVYSVVKVGMTEREVALILETKMKELGASDVSFDTIVASGARGALPHGVASNKKIDSGDFVTIDFGCIYNGYCSDITRTFVMGEDYDPKMKEIYDIVLEANLLGHKHLKAGLKGKEVDKVVRDFITEKGYGDHFGHGLGHSLGVLVHESPRLSIAEEAILESGNIVTIEPGIYVDGLGGVRIEDDMLVTEDGCISLTTTPKELRIIK